MRIRIPLNADGSAAGPPSPPEACDSADLQGLADDLNLCDEVIIFLGEESCPITVPGGMSIKLINPYGYPDQARADAEHSLNSAAVVIDGVTVADQQSDVAPYEDEDGSGWGFTVEYEWENPEPGAHSVFGPGPEASALVFGRTRTCEINVLESSSG
jgi:hypothetical protein